MAEPQPAVGYDDSWYDEDNGERACSLCGGYWYMQECDDPIQCCDARCDGTWHPCVACNGTGLARSQWLW